MEKELPNSDKNTDKFISSAGFYRQVIDSLQDYAILTMDKQLIINSWSAGSVKIFGYQPEEILGRHFRIVYSDEDKINDIPAGEIEKALVLGRAIDNRWHRRKDGSLFYAYGLVFPLQSKDERLLGYVKILRDLTQRKKSEEALRKYIKNLEELNTHKEGILAILSHDLRSPLTGMIQMAEMLKDDFKNMGDDRLQRILDIQYELSTNELRMLDYLLDWARIKYASEVFSPTYIDLLPAVNKVFGILKEIAALSSIDLQCEMEENTFVFADEKMLLSILQNLVSNGIRHSHTGGTVTVSATKKDDFILVRVKDTGVGMSEEMRNLLFLPQIKELSEVREKDKGGGIGLLLVKGFLERNGGEIIVESEEGEGTSFYFTLPIDKPSTEKKDVGITEFDENT